MVMTEHDLTTADLADLEEKMRPLGLVARAAADALPVSNIATGRKWGWLEGEAA